MTRITENMIANSMLRQMQLGQQKVDRYSNEISSGLKILQPGDSFSAGTVSQFKEQISRLESYEDRVSMVQGQLEFQDEVLRQASEVLVRVEELASQAANETLSVEQREHVAAEVFQLRDHLVHLANSTYQGKYVFAGADNDTPPFSATTYANYNTNFPASQERYVYSGTTGAQLTRNVQVSDSVNLTVNTPGDQIFQDAVYAMERLGRSLVGYETLPAPTGTPATPTVPDGSGNAYNMPTDYAAQTQDIQETIDLIKLSRSSDLLPEQISVASRLNRLESVRSILEATKFASKHVLSDLQDADITESVSKLQQAQIALEASYAVTSQVLNLSILNYL